MQAAPQPDPSIFDSSVAALRRHYHKAWRALALTPAKRALPGYKHLEYVVRAFFEIPGGLEVPKDLASTNNPSGLFGWAFTRPESPFTRAVVRAGGWVSACRLVAGELSDAQEEAAWQAIPLMSALGVLHPGMLDPPEVTRRPRSSTEAFQASTEAFRASVPGPERPLRRAIVPVSCDTSEMVHTFRPGRAGAEVKHGLVVAAFHLDEGSREVAHVEVDTPPEWEGHYEGYCMIQGRAQPFPERAGTKPLSVPGHEDFLVVLEFDETTPVLERPPSGSGYKVTIELWEKPPALRAVG